MTVDILAGDDINRNGVLDADEKSSTGWHDAKFWAAFWNTRRFIAASQIFILTALHSRM